ncbi:Crp/Fnr family transcriptional regulator [Zobellella maritima]|uniref:Crp/Fnr family transcriptional regulator n=1 Tax=Zobellella maritima TaxID=2059725 RepID=UPI000E308E76|nr:Crp/Fnr family transcriptional regulator [Zobellella maritima]
MEGKARAFAALRQALAGYYPLGDDTWAAFRAICRYRELARHEVLYRAGELPDSFAFVHAGLFRVYVVDDKGNEYNKNFFDEGRFPGAMTALLKNEPSRFTIEALEDAAIIEIHFQKYRRLLLARDDLKLFQIHYLEQNWLLAKDAREVELVQEGATQRYLRFLREYPSLANRLPQYHIASHLGITPTQLSRIRKKCGSLNLCK